ncbi:ATP-binding protein [Neolewinella litorea]|uniref:histidine kinase n=1 Tax=Neolewinella litorea TaxID=2562452 RepID=A0A4S4NAQ3_9BACT|nr:ATP-binding protein [Neolewinella litorea]THH36349.1 GAF domain-containing protein [Neolewinella litorea]
MPSDLYIQPHSSVVILSPEWRIRALSDNLADLLGADAGAMIDAPASRLFSAPTIDKIRNTKSNGVTYPIALTAEEPINWGHRQCLPRRRPEGILIEIERCAPDPEPIFVPEINLRDLNETILAAPTTRSLLQTVCNRLATLFGFSRVIVFELDTEGNGFISTEFNDGSFPLLLGVHYRPEDFAQVALSTYAEESVLVTNYESRNSAALIGDVSGFESLIQLGLGCRMPYPLLLDFMREMEIQTVLSVALYNKDKLWGMVFAHAHQTIVLDYQLRTFVHLVGNLTSQALTYRVFDQTHRNLVASDHLRARLRENIARASTLVDGLQHSDPSLLDVVPETSGAAILLENQFVTIGSTPTEEQILDILAWAGEEISSKEVYHTAHLEAVYPPAADFTDTASGLLLVPLNARCTDWIVWFRPESVEEVTYGSLSAELEPDEKSRFQLKAEVRRGYSRVWSPADIDAARNLQSYIRDVVMEKYSQLSRVNHQLQMAYEEMQSFSYTVSHDLRAPLRGIDGFAEIFIEDYGTKIDAQGQALIQTIQQNAARMNQYIADILELSRVGRASMVITDCRVEELVQSAMENLNKGRATPVTVSVAENLPPIRGDAQQLGIVFHHLLSNAIKYSPKTKPPEITVGFRRINQFGDGEFFVADKGIGISPIHQDRVFGMFNRLVTQDDYAGNGVGLAIVRSIIIRHGGEIRIESQVGRGTTFLFHTDPHELKAGKTN